MTRKTNMLAGMLAASAFGFLMATAALAQQPDDNRLDEAWRDALEDFEGVVTPQQQAQLNLLAYQAAVARVCDGFKLHLENYAKGVNEIILSNADKLDDQQTLARHTNILLTLGTTYGLFLAEGNAKKESFCKAAADDKKDTGFVSVWE